MKLLIVFMFFTGCFFSKPNLTPKYDIVLCVGQSNMMGFAPLDVQDSGSTAWLWNNTAWEIADGHLNRFNNLYNPAYSGINTLSIVNSFAKEAAATQIKPLTGVVVNARGGSFSSEWVSTYMALSITRAQTALAASPPGSKISAILWHQGESDADMPNQGDWGANFATIRQMVDTSLGYDVPIIVGGLSTAGYWYGLLNVTIQQVVATTHDCYYVSSNGLTTTDATHFDAPSYRNFGLRYYAVYNQVKL